MRTKLVAGNWKMHGSQAMVRDLLEGLLAGTLEPNGTDMAVFPPFHSLPSQKSGGLGRS